MSCVDGHLPETEAGGQRVHFARHEFLDSVSTSNGGGRSNEGSVVHVIIRAFNLWLNHVVERAYL
jgi:hypothetical protein